MRKEKAFRHAPDIEHAVANWKEYLQLFVRDTLDKVSGEGAQVFEMNFSHIMEY